MRRPFNTWWCGVLSKLRYPFVNREPRSAGWSAPSFATERLMIQSAGPDVPRPVASFLIILENCYGNELKERRPLQCEEQTKVKTKEMHSDCYRKWCEETRRQMGRNGGLRTDKLIQAPGWLNVFQRLYGHSLTLTCFGSSCSDF